MQEKAKMIADHEEKYGQIGGEAKGLLLQWAGWSEIGGKLEF